MSMFTDVEMGDLFIVHFVKQSYMQPEPGELTLGLLVAFNKRDLLYEIYSPSFSSMGRTIIFNSTSFMNLLTKVK